MAHERALRVKVQDRSVIVGSSQDDPRVRCAEIPVHSREVVVHVVEGVWCARHVSARVRHAVVTDERAWSISGATRGSRSSNTGSRHQSAARALDDDGSDHAESGQRVTVCDPQLAEGERRVTDIASRGGKVIPRPVRPSLKVRGLVWPNLSSSSSE